MGTLFLLGFQPSMEITCLNHELTIKDLIKDETKKLDVDHPNEEIRMILDSYKSPQIEGLPPFTGGLVGYFSYDYIKYSEPKLSLHHDVEFNDMDLMLFDTVICFDHYKQKIILITGCFTNDIEASYEEAKHKLLTIKNLLKKGKKKHFEPLLLKVKLNQKLKKKILFKWLRKQNIIFMKEISSKWYYQIHFEQMQLDHFLTPFVF